MASMTWGMTGYGFLADEKTPPPEPSAATLIAKGRLVLREPSPAQKTAAGSIPNAEIRWNPETGAPESIRAAGLAAQNIGGQGLALKAGAAYADNAIAVMDRLSALYRLRDAPSEFSVFRVDADNLGYHHVRLYQQYRGLTVFGGEVIVHFNAQDAAYQVNGRYVPDIDIATDPILTLEEAVEAAQADLTARGKPEGIVARGPELMVYAWTTAPTLAYELTLSCGIADLWRYWVDARTGIIINGFNEVAKAWGDRNTVEISGNLLAGEGATPKTVMGTSLDLGWATPEIYYYLASTNSLWATWTIWNAATEYWEDTNSVAHRLTPAWGSSDSAEFSAAYNFDMAMRYFHDAHGRRSFDDMNHEAQVNVHVPYQGTDDAWYLPSNDQFYFLPGNSNATLTVLDVCGHEFTHAVTFDTIHLVYQGESGALDESFADIFGTAIEFHAQPSGVNAYPNRIAGYADWLIGEDSTYVSPNIAFRDMRNPQRLGQPSYYKGANWLNTTNSYDHGGVHRNDGVQNFFFYLLAEGGTGTNDGHAYRVTGISLTNAIKIAYRVLSDYAYQVSAYSDSDTAWKSAAMDLNTNWVNSVQAAWAAVGIGEAPVIGDSYTPVPGDFDGDGRADFAGYETNGHWHFWLSQNNGGSRLDVSTLTGAFGTPVAADFDGDGKADPAVYDGNWHVWLSQNGYARLDVSTLTGASGTPIAADFDGDGKADPAVYNTNGNWHVWLSQNGYARLDVSTLTGASGTPAAADYDHDGLADPTVYEAPGTWHIWQSRQGYQRTDLDAFAVPTE